MKQTCLINAKKDEKGIEGQARNDRSFRMKTKLLCLWISMLPIIGCAQELFSVTTKYSFNDSVKTVIITFKNASNEEIVVSNIWYHGVMPNNSSYYELQCLDKKNQMLNHYFYPFGYEPEMKPSRIRIEPHSSITFRYNLYSRIKEDKNADKIKKIAIRYHIRYYITGGGSTLFYDKTEPAVVLK
jgi:hypothetical protein